MLRRCMVQLAPMAYFSARNPESPVPSVRSITLGNGAATLVQGANDISIIAVDGTPLVAR